MLTIIMGKTCSGKNAVVSELVKRGWSQIVTYTTRPRRRGEIEGREYHFLTDEEFEKKDKKGFFVETQTYNVNGKIWKYGSPLWETLDAGVDDENHVIILTPTGVSEVVDVLQGYSPNDNVNVIYLYTNRATILKRLKSRKDKNDSIERRMKADDEDFSNATSLATKIVYNNESDSLPSVVDKIISYSI